MATAAARPETADLPTDGKTEQQSEDVPEATTTNADGLNSIDKTSATYVGTDQEQSESSAASMNQHTTPEQQSFDIPPVTYPPENPTLYDESASDQYTSYAYPSTQTDQQQGDDKSHKEETDESQVPQSVDVSQATAAQAQSTEEQPAGYYQGESQQAGFVEDHVHYADSYQYTDDSSAYYGNDKASYQAENTQSGYGTHHDVPQSDRSQQPSSYPDGREHASTSENIHSGYSTQPHSEQPAPYPDGREHTSSTQSAYSAQHDMPHSDKPASYPDGREHPSTSENIHSGYGTQHDMPHSDRPQQPTSYPDDREHPSSSHNWEGYSQQPSDYPQYDRGRWDGYSNTEYDYSSEPGYGHHDSYGQGAGYDANRYAYSQPTGSWQDDRYQSNWQGYSDSNYNQRPQGGYPQHDYYNSSYESAREYPHANYSHTYPPSGRSDFSQRGRGYYRDRPYSSTGYNDSPPYSRDYHEPRSYDYDHHYSRHYDSAYDETRSYKQAKTPEDPRQLKDPRRPAGRNDTDVRSSKEGRSGDTFVQRRSAMLKRAEIHQGNKHSKTSRGPQIVQPHRITESAESKDKKSDKVKQSEGSFPKRNLDSFKIPKRKGVTPTPSPVKKSTPIPALDLKTSEAELEVLEKKVPSKSSPVKPPSTSSQTPGMSTTTVSTTSSIQAIASTSKSTSFVAGTVSTTSKSSGSAVKLPSIKPVNTVTAKKKQVSSTAIKNKVTSVQKSVLPSQQSAVPTVLSTLDASTLFAIAATIQKTLDQAKAEKLIRMSKSASTTISNSSNAAITFTSATTSSSTSTATSTSTGPISTMSKPLTVQAPTPLAANSSTKSATSAPVIPVVPTLTEAKPTPPVSDPVALESQSKASLPSASTTANKPTSSGLVLATVLTSSTTLMPAMKSTYSNKHMNKASTNLTASVSSLPTTTTSCVGESISATMQTSADSLASLVKAFCTTPASSSLATKSTPPPVLSGSTADTLNTALTSKVNLETASEHTIAKPSSSSMQIPDSSEVKVGTNSTSIEAGSQGVGVAVKRSRPTEDVDETTNAAKRPKAEQDDLQSSPDKNDNSDMPPKIIPFSIKLKKISDKEIHTKYEQLSEESVSQVHNKTSGTSPKKTSSRKRSVSRSKKKVHASQHLPHSSSTVVCSLCHKKDSELNLGFLFGPYKPNVKLESALNNSSEDVPAVGNGSAESDRKADVWVHADCAAWAPGVCLVGGKLIGLQEAVTDAQKMICVHCKENGATLCCSTHNCKKYYHFYCAREASCLFKEDQFTIACTKHSSKDVIVRQ